MKSQIYYDGGFEMLENDGKNWTWEETLIAFDLYTRIPFSKISVNNPEIIDMANLLKRKPAAVAKKLFNISAHDPKQINRGVSGLSHSSKFDKLIWDEFERDSLDISVNAKVELAKIENKPVEELIDNDTNTFIIEVFPYGEDKTTATAVRIGQCFFRKAVLSAYNRKCCVTGIAEPKLLIASHIKPWRVSASSNERTNPRNGLCLNALHDRAFDQGLITINYDYEIIISSRLERTAMDDETKRWINCYSHKAITLPDKFLPDRAFIQYHNDMIFEKHGDTFCA